MDLNKIIDIHRYNTLNNRMGETIYNQTNFQALVHQMIANQERIFGKPELMDATKVIHQCLHHHQNLSRHIMQALSRRNYFLL